jgi:hypothetical protein
MFLDLLAGGGLLAAGYIVGYLTARTVHRRSAGQEDCTCGHPEAHAKLSLKKYSPITARNDDLKVLSGRR